MMRHKILKRHLDRVQQDLTAVVATTGNEPLAEALERIETVLLQAIREGHDIYTVLRPRSHCRKGHLYDSGNLIIDSSGKRRCRQCKAIDDQRYRAKHIVKIAARYRAKWLAKKTHCPRGHPLKGANVVRDMRGARRCRKCKEGQP